MQTLTITFILPRANMSGGIKSNRLIAEALVRRGHTVNIAFVDTPSPWPGPDQPRRLVRRLWREWRSRKRQRHQLEGSSARLIPVERDRIEPGDVPDSDVVIGTWWETMEQVLTWPDAKGMKAYFVRGDETFREETPRIEATYAADCLKFTISTWLQSILMDRYGSPSILVPNGVDWDQFDSSPRGKRLPPPIGMLYGVEPWKDAITGFQAMAMVREAIPDVRLVAFGSRPLRREHGAPAGLDYRVRPPQGDIPRTYQSVDCWLVPSKTEGFGMPGIEASASHTPVVSTRCGGPADYIHEGENGFLVPVGDAAALAERALEVLQADDERWRRMSAASYRMARNFNWDRSAEILEGALMESMQVV